MNIAQHKAAQGWRIWGVLALAFVIVLLYRVSPGVILERLIIDLKIQEAALAGTLAGVYPIVYCLMQIPSGLLADFWGPRKTVTAGMLVGGFGQFIFALVPDLFYALLGRRGVVGLGVPVVLVSSLKFLGFSGKADVLLWFSKRIKRTCLFRFGSWYCKYRRFCRGCHFTIFMGRYFGLER